MLIYSIIGVILCVFSLTVYADYDCLCNYRVETPMYSAQDVNSRPAGYMYEFDCKPAASTNSVQETWTAIINEHFIAYVEKGSGLQMQVCQGEIPDEDKLFTSTKQASTTTTTTTTPKPTTTSSTTTSPKPTTASTTTTTPKPTTASTSTTTPKPTTTSTTTTPKPTATSTITTTSNPTTTITQPTTPSTTTTTKPTTTSTTTTPKPTTASTTSTTPKPTTTSSTSSWSTTSDWLIHWNSTHFPFTTKKPHQTTHSHITTRKPHHTTDWLIHWNNTHSPFTSQPPSQLSNSHGNMKLCPGILTRTNDAKWLRQYKDYCYEFVGHAMNWYDAEADCWQRLGHGGELLEIYTQDIQHYITNFLQEINNHRYIWIGLQDIDREEHFSWDSGARLTYKNWKPDRKGNHLPHGREDCVMMLTNGLWDDALCSHDIRRRFLVNANNINVRRPFICQYPIRSSHHG